MKAIDRDGLIRTLPLGANVTGQRFKAIQFDSKDLDQLAWNIRHDPEATAAYLSQTATALYPDKE